MVEANIKFLPPAWRAYSLTLLWRVAGFMVEVCAKIGLRVALISTGPD
jgi:hypothetical protein